MMDEQMTLWQVAPPVISQQRGCFLHDEAYLLLTDEWQRLVNLKSERISSGVFEDLVFWGYADFFVESVGRVDTEGHFRVFSCRQWYRRGSGTREGANVEAANE